MIGVVRDLRAFTTAFRSLPFNLRATSAMASARRRSPRERRRPRHEPRSSLFFAGCRALGEQVCGQTLPVGRGGRLRRRRLVRALVAGGNDPAHSGQAVIRADGERCDQDGFDNRRKSPKPAERPGSPTSFRTEASCRSTVYVWFPSARPNRISSARRGTWWKRSRTSKGSSGRPIVAWSRAQTQERMHSLAHDYFKIKGC